MADREKVIKGLEACLDEADCTKCYKDGPGFGYACRDSLMRDALVALKEREAVEPKLVGVNTWICGECGAFLGWEEFTQSGLELVENRFCPHCGRRVKWNA